ncbi:hypothetical protein E4U41_002120 [Claviceps citrina]|nr:hypothetical protein E4U41_002120 [Claviceps citrina]
MKPLSSFAIGYTLFRVAEGLSLPQGDRQQQTQQGAQPRVVGLPVHRSKGWNPVVRDRSLLRKRDGTVSGTLDNLQTFYFLNATLGTPPQPVRLHVDTGSSDMWVNTPTSTLCSSLPQRCAEAETYSANSSSTYQYVSSNFNIAYLDGSGASGDYGTDVLRFGGQTVSSLQFGIGYASGTRGNILGIGYPSNEAQVVLAGRKPYPNLPAKLHADGKISSTSFSLWLNNVDAEAGSVLFGGIDTEKFRGSLVGVPIQKANNDYTQFFITMTGLDVGSETVASDMALAVLLDSGASLTLLPNHITSQIYLLVNAQYQERHDVAFVPCSLRQQNATMTFRFSFPAAITVSLSEMILDYPDRAGKAPKFDNGDEACVFGIRPAHDSATILGDTFLRSAYVVYDMDKNEIALANATSNVTRSNVVEINKGLRDEAPYFTRASNPVAATTGLPSSGSGSGTPSSPEGESGAPGRAPGSNPASMAVWAVVAAALVL